MIRLAQNTEGFSLVGIIFGVVLICILMLMTYSRKPVFHGETKSYLQEHGVHTDGYESVLNSTVSQIREYEKIHVSSGENFFRRYVNAVE